jgi:hypothetical protein
MPLAAPLILPFAELAGITIAGLGMAAASKKVSDFISDNPEISTQILTTLVPGGVGLNALFKKKAKEDSDDESVEVAPEDKTREERAKEMKKRFKEGKGDKREIGKKGFEEVIKPVKDIEDLLEGEERYDGSLEDAPKPKFDYTKFFKADGGRIGYVGGGLATTQDFANALKSVSAGTTYQQQTQAKEYARNEAANELRAAIQGGGIDSFLGGAGLSNYRSMFPNDRAGTNRQGDFTGTYNVRKEQLLNDLMNKKLSYTSYAPPPKKTYRTVSPEAQALNMSQSTYEDIIRSGADPKQYYIDYQNRIMTEGGNYGTPGTSSYTGPQLLKYGQVIGGPGMGIAGPGTAPGATPPTQAQMNQMMQNNPAGYMDFADLVKTFSADPYKGLQEEIKDMVGGRDTGYMGGQDYYDINVLGLDGRGIAEKYGLQYADGGRIGKVLGFVNDGENIIGADLKKDPYEQYQDKFQEAFDISKNYPSNSLGPFAEQGMSSDMRHQLGASGGKDTIIDYLSNFGINPQGKFADTVGNLGIGAATALTEIPDAFKMASEAMKRKDIDALTSGKFLTQPLEDVRSNFAAMNIPYGLTTQEKENLILSNYPGYVPNITTPNYSYGTAAAADFQDGQILQPNVVPERTAPATYYNSAPNFNADVLLEEEDAQYNLPQKNMLQNLKNYLPFIGDKSITGMLTRGIGQFFNNIGDRIPSTPQYQQYTPGYNYGNLNPNLIDDFYDPATGLNRFDRAKTLFGQSRTLSEFLSKRRERAAAEADLVQRREIERKLEREKALARNTSSNIDYGGFVSGGGTHSSDSSFTGHSSATGGGMGQSGWGGPRADGGFIGQYSNGGLATMFRRKQ